MFYGRMEEYPLESPAYLTDAYNHSRITWQDHGTIRAFIVLQDKTPKTTNDTNVFASSLVGYTQDLRVKEGWRIGGKFVVKSVTRHRMDQILYLEEVTDGV